MRAALMHGQIWVIYLLNSVFYTRIYKYILKVAAEKKRTRTMSSARSRSDESGATNIVSQVQSRENSVEKTVKILQYYPIILLVTWFPLIVMRVFEYASFHIPCWVYAFSLGMTNVQGLFNAVVFFSVSVFI